MNSKSKTAHAPILRVFQSKDQTRAFYNKISRVYDLLSERSEAPMRNAGLALLSARDGESIRAEDQEKGRYEGDPKIFRALGSVCSACRRQPPAFPLGIVRGASRYCEI